MATLTLSGEIDLVSSRQLSATLQEAAGALDPEETVVDLTAVTFIDSTGLGVLLKAKERFRRQGRPLVFVVPDGPVLAALRMSGLEKVLRPLPVAP